MPNPPKPTMYCSRCGKESTNLRVCPHCFTPYPEGGAGRTSGGAPRRSSGSIPVVPGDAAAPRRPTGAQAAIPEGPPPRRATGAQPVIDPERPAYGRRSTGAIRLVPADVVEGSSGALAPVIGGITRTRRLLLWAAVAVGAIALVMVATDPNEVPETAPPRSVPSTLTVTPSEREAALALIQSTRAQALVETQADEVLVSYSAAAFPLDPAAQRQLVEAFAKADEMVEGRKRRIVFYNPAGRVFAQADGVAGLTMRQP